MRLLYIIWERIKSHFRNHKTIVILFLLGIYSSTLFFTYYYGDNVKSTLEHAEPELIAEYELCVESGFDCGDERILELERQGVVTFYFDFELQRSRSSDIFYVMPGEEELVEDTSLFTCIARRTDDYDHEIRYGEGQLQGRENGILLPIDSLRFISADKLKSTEGACLHLSGVDMEVLGVHGHAYEACIPYGFVEKNRLRADRIRLSLEETLTEKEANTFAADLAEVFPEADIATGYELYEELLEAEEEMVAFKMQRAMTMMLLSVFTFMFLAKYLFDMSVYEDVVYRMIGTNRWKITVIAFGEILLLAVLAIGAAVLTHAALYKPLFGQISKYSALYFTVGDYLLVAVSALAVCMLTCLPFLFLVWRKSSVRAKAQAG